MLQLINLHRHIIITKAHSLHMVHSWYFTFYGFGWIYNGIYPSLSHHTMYFYCSKNPLFSIYSSLSKQHPLNPWKTMIFLLSIVLPFLECHWNCIVYSLFRLASFTSKCFKNSLKAFPYLFMVEYYPSAICTKIY